MNTEHYGILYFSGTGNTEWVMRRVAEGLRAHDAECTLLAADQLLAHCGQAPGSEADPAAVRQALADTLAQTTTLLLGYPVYESAVPLPMRQLFPLLPDGEDRRLGAVCTYMMAGGDCCHLPEKALGPRGYRSVLATYVKMPNNIKFPAFRFFKIENGDELARFYESAQKAVDEIVHALTEQQVHIEGRGIGDYLLGVSQRWGEDMVTNYVQDHLFALASCSRCRLCAETCPMGNISFEKGYPEFGRRCCDCLRCYHQCPESAIQITDGTIDTEAYPRYRGFDGWRAPRIRKVRRKKSVSADG